MYTLKEPYKFSEPSQPFYSSLITPCELSADPIVRTIPTAPTIPIISNIMQLSGLPIYPSHLHRVPSEPSQTSPL